MEKNLPEGEQGKTIGGVLLFCLFTDAVLLQREEKEGI